MAKLFSLAKRSFHHFSDWSYAFLKNTNLTITLKEGKTYHSKQYVLTKHQEKEVRNFWKPYHRVNFVYNNFYTEKTGIFDPRYIPDNLYYGPIMLHFNAHRLAKTIDNKCYYDLMFHDIPQPKTLACRKCGMYFINRAIVSEQEMYDVISTEKEVFVKKASDSSGGSAVQCIPIDSTGNYRSKIASLVASWGKSDIIIQQTIIQHDALAKLSPSSVNTMRLMVLLHNGEAKICSSVLRLAVKDARVDNFSSGGIAVGINDDGNLKKYAYNFRGDRFEKHPVTGIKFEGYRLPAFEAAKALVKKAQCYFPCFKLVAWDIATDKNGHPIMIEGNLTNGELDLLQLCNGPLFGDDTEEILKEIFCK